MTRADSSKNNDVTKAAPTKTTNVPETSTSDVTRLDESKVRVYLLREIAAETRELESQSVRIADELADSLRLLRQLKRSVVRQYYASSRSNARVHPAVLKVEAEVESGGGGGTSSGGEGTSGGGEGKDYCFGAMFDDGVRKSKRRRVTQPASAGGDVPRPLMTHKVRLYVGTMCKYLGNADTSMSTHKWTVYLRNSEANAENVCHHIAQVTFVLHESYKPHHVVRVGREPFKITREGWGEFVMKIVVRFQERELNRNVELVHPVNFLHVKSMIPLISLETPIDIELTTTHRVTREDEGEASDVKQDVMEVEGTGKTINVKQGVVKEVDATAAGGQGKAVEQITGNDGVALKVKQEVEDDDTKEVGEMEGSQVRREEPDLRRTVLEYLTDEDTMMVMDGKLEQDVDISSI